MSTAPRRPMSRPWFVLLACAIALAVAVAVYLITTRGAVFSASPDENAGPAAVDQPEAVETPAFEPQSAQSSTGAPADPEISSTLEVSPTPDGFAAKETITPPDGSAPGTLYGTSQYDAFLASGNTEPMGPVIVVRDISTDSYLQIASGRDHEPIEVVLPDGSILEGLASTAEDAPLVVIPTENGAILGLSWRGGLRPVS